MQQASLYERAVALHRAGRWSEAVGFYLAHAQLRPDDAEALYRLGLCRFQSGAVADGLLTIQKSLAAAPALPQAFASLATAAKDQPGGGGAALTALRRATRLAPELAELHFNFANTLPPDDPAAAAHLRMAVALRPDFAAAESALGRREEDAGKFEQAYAARRRALLLRPANAEDLLAAGNLARRVGDAAAAAACHRRAVAIDPANHSHLNNLGAALWNGKRLSDSIAAFNRALTVAPNVAEIATNRALALCESGRALEAVSGMRRLWRERPDDAGAARNLSTCLLAANRIDEALAYGQLAATIVPDDQAAWRQIAHIHRSKKNYAAAEQAVLRGLTLDDADTELQVFKAMILINRQQHKRALETCEELAAKGADFATLRSAMALAAWNCGLLKQAVANYRKALSVSAPSPAIFSNYLFLLNYVDFLSEEEIFQEHLNFANLMPELDEKTKFSFKEKKEYEKTRIGYLSSDFRNHSVSYFIEKVLENHDRSKFEIYCYAELAQPDGTTSRLQGLADHWRAVANLSDVALAARIRADHIDILIELTGHTADNRLPALARRAAPIQASWIGYPNTLGLREIDYRFTDAVTDPPEHGADALHCEQLIRLPGNFLCYRPEETAPEIQPRPIDAKEVVFGCFNNLNKVTSQVIAVWAQILNRVPESQIIMKAPQLNCPSNRQRILDLFQENGVDSERVDLYAHTPDARSHLELYNKVDIALDPFPYNGTTTTCEALWMGTPVVALRGGAHRARVSASLLTAAGSPELIAENIDAYIDLAIRLAADPAWRRRLESGMRRQLDASPLCDGPGFTRRLESELDKLLIDWRRKRAQMIADDPQRAEIRAPEIEEAAPSGSLQEAGHAFATGDYQRAEALCRAILRADPDYPDAINLLGVVYSKLGRAQDAFDLIKSAIEKQPGVAFYHVNLGNTLRDMGRCQEAAAACREAVRLSPTTPTFHFCLGLAEQSAGNPAAAAAAYRETLRLAPNRLDALSNLNIVLREIEQFGEACDAIRQARQHNPTHRGYIDNHGLTLREMGRAAEAVRAFRQALALDPGSAGTWSNITAALRNEARFAAAAIAADRAARLWPDEEGVHANIAFTAALEGRLSVAVAAAKRAAALAPQSYRSFAILSATARDFGEPVKAAWLLDRSIRLRLSSPIRQASDMPSTLLFILNYRDDLSPQQIFHAHAAWGEKFAASQELEPYVPHDEPIAGRRLRIGYLSGDFREHSVSYFFEPLLRHHDRSRFEIFCYANPAGPEDAVTERLRGLADQWINVRALSDADLVRQARADRLDLLVDLSGHTTGGRLRACAARMAPTQAAWLGYPNTTGVAAMDYRVTDAVADPPGPADALHVERLWRLPDGFLCYQPRQAVIPVGPPPHLAQGRITFGSFNNPAKISATTLALWKAALDAVPNSRLLLKNKIFIDSATCEAYKRRFAAAGIAPERVALAPMVREPEGHLSIYRAVDIALDTFPYNGATTTCEALWMGVPVVTLAGDRHAARVGASLLSALGLPELIATDLSSYARIAANLAADSSRLAALRAGLRARLEASPLCDGPGFARRMEAAYLGMIARESAASLESADAAYRRALAAFQAGDPAEAAAIAQESARRHPDHKPTVQLAGVALGQTGAVAEALPWLKAYARLAAGDAAACLNLAAGLTLLGDPGAEAATRAALSLRPDFATAWLNMAGGAGLRGDVRSAAAAARRGRIADPYDLNAAHRSGETALAAGDIEAAACAFRMALALRPDSGVAACNLGATFYHRHVLGPAGQWFDRALAINPDHLEAIVNAAAVQADAADAAGAARRLERALALKPDHRKAQSNHLLNLHYDDKVSAEALFQAHAAWGRAYAAQTPRATPAARPAADDRPLRVGYVSADFCGHSVAFFFDALLEGHAQGTAVQAYCYSDVVAPDYFTRRFEQLAAAWRPIAGLDDDAVARRIADDGVDILVDLAGHTARNRLGVFAIKPAPVQVSWLGYPDTTGLPTIDYRFTDAVADPPGTADALSVERLIRLPNGFLCYRPGPSSAEPGPLPALAAGRVVFGSFNNLAKLTAATVALWSAALRAVPGSRLLLKAKALADAAARRRVENMFAEQGITPERLEMLSWAPHLKSHLEIYNQVDIALDAYPYNGTTTTCEALWMGVPLVTLSGDRHAARVSAAILSRVGLGSLVARDVDGFAAIAAALAADTARLANLRSGMRRRLLQSPLCDAKAFTSQIEQAYRQMLADRTAV